jgi:hypothetical protein
MGKGTHGHVWLVLVRLGQSVEDELFVVAGVYFRDHRGCLYLFPVTSVTLWVDAEIGIENEFGDAARSPAFLILVCALVGVVVDGRRARRARRV